MEFFDRKEEVLDLELTQYGKYLLSIGKLSPTYYAFFDDDINYDTQYQGDPPALDHTAVSAGPSENQKDTEDRIKETPRIKVIHSVDTVEKSVNQSVITPIEGIKVFGSGAGAVAETEEFYIDGNFISENFGEMGYKYPIPPKQNTSGLHLPLGTSKYNSEYYPAFDLNFSKGKILTGKSIYYDSGSYGIKRMPQIELEVTFETSIETAEGNYGSVKVVTIKDSSEFADYNHTSISEDGTFVKVEEDYISINLRELNSLEAKENFIIEVYEVENPDTTNEILLPMKFGGESFSDLYADYLYDKTSNSLKTQDNFVEYFFKVSVDDEIIEGANTEVSPPVLPGNDYDVCDDDE
tara:strand:- start:4936 stop:5991 length:1056 start_codon:yes stop_codon:yes gene_type:complete